LEFVGKSKSLTVSCSYHGFLPMNEKQLNVSYEKILRTLINTVVRCVSKGSSESSRIWSVKFGKTNVLDSQQFLHSALLSSEQLETGNKDKDCR
jgi:hypothetical protein